MRGYGILTLLLAFLGVASVQAHPLPNLRFDRTVHIRVSPTEITVQYNLELNEWTMVLDGNKLLEPGDRFTTGREFAALYAKRKAPFLADNLQVTLDSQHIPLQVARTEVVPERDHLKFRFQFVHAWKPNPGKQLNLQFRDDNFDDKSGKVTLTLAADSTFTVHDLIEPIGLRGKSPLELKPGEDELLRRASAILELPVVEEKVPTPEDVPTPEVTPATEPSTEVVVLGEKPTLVQALRDRGLTALFDTSYGIGLLLLAAAVFGMAHAFTPGHGKTLVAAYLVGERGTIAHALILGLTTTLAHTGSVLIIAVVLWRVYREGVPDSVQGWLQLGGGLLIALVGLWLFLRRLQGKADHVHIGGHGHHHHHGHAHDHSHEHGHDHHHHHVMPPAKDQPFGWARVILLGIGGGIIPCWDAVMLLLVAIAAGKLGFAVPLLLAFSLGLALVLIALGITVVLATRAGSRRYGERRWFQLLPILSSALLIGMGIWLCREGIQRLIEHERNQAQQVQG